MINHTQTKSKLANELEWFATDLGKLLLQQERQAFERLSAQLFGLQLLQLGLLDAQQPLMTDTPVRRQTLITNHNLGAREGLMQAEYNQLPVQSDAIDAVLLPHTLDFSVDPQQVLKEVERCLIAEGRVIISGFNPFSLWGIKRRFYGSRKKAPWHGNFLSYTRLHDWLSLLGFDVEQTEVLMFRPPLEKLSIMHKLEFLESGGQKLWPMFAGIYVVKAVKRISTLTPIRPVWKRRPRLLASPQVVEPTTRGVRHG
ncbi:MAG: methyltransferase domain-containing protein [Chromatiales bacterium]